MQPIKKFLEANFRFKVLVPVVTVMIVMLALTVWFVDFRTKNQISDDARRALKIGSEVYAHLETTHLNYLRMRFQTLANVPTYNAVLTKRDENNQPDFNSIQDQLARMLKDESLASQNVQFVMFTPDDSPSSAEPMIQPAALPAPVVTKIVKGLNFIRSSDQMNAVIKADQDLYNIVCIPVYDQHHEHARCGTLTFGEKIDWQTAQEYSQLTQKQIAFMAGGQVIASTFPNAADKSQFESIFVQLAAGNNPMDAAVEPVKATIGKDHYFCARGKFSGANKDPSVGILLFSTYDPPLGIRQTQQLLLAAIIIAIFLGSALILYFINKATEPLRELHDAAEAVGRGDFTKRINIRSKDEFGELSHAFNQMTENIELSQSKLKQTVETLKTTQAQLIQSEKLSAVGEFVAGVAHELNNPLAAVMGFSEMLRNADVGEKHARHLDLVFKSAQRCQKIVQSLLSFARRAAPERKPVSVNRLIEDVLEMIAYPLRTSNVKVITQFGTKLPVVLADGHQVQQVVLNLINNARQAIEAHTDSGRITITTSHDVRFVRIVIQDNGPGIAPENLKRIFDPFFTTKEVGKGTGLGLSLCYGMIREHGGNILVSSQPGEGASFTIELPVADEAAWFETSFMTKTATATSQPDIREGAGKKILVVDDEESLLQMIKEELARHSYDVVTVLNGESALREIRAQKFDAVVCDLKMPGLNGRQVYERLREDNVEISRRMVFVTGDIIGDQLKDFLETEKRPCLTKPFSLADLRQAVKDTLRA